MRFYYLLLFIFTVNAVNAQSIRVATFNIKEFSAEKINTVDENGIGSAEQLCAAAAIIQKIRPDILVLNEIDHDYTGSEANYTINAERFLQNYLHQGENTIDYAYIYAAACNTGIPAGVDLNGDGYHATVENVPSAEYAADCFGWGEYPGQYSMALLSRYPIQENEIRTFQKFLWKDLPNNHLPADYYSAEAVDKLRLSSKSHWDVPIEIDGHTLHILMSHPTPPGFDGDEDRNGRRNFDEIQFWVHYLNDDDAIVDDNGKSGGDYSKNPFIIAGDLNASPKNKAVYNSITAIDQLLQHPRIQNTSKLLTSRGVVEMTGKADSKNSTAYFGSGWDTQIDYVLPSQNLNVHDGGVYWPALSEDAAGHKNANLASDHRLVWLDISFQ